MNKINDLIEESKSLLFKEPCVQEYFRLKEILESDDELIKLDADMKKHQKLMCDNQNNDEIYLKEKSLYELSKEKIETNPVWINFKTVKEEVCSLLVDIQNILR